MKTKTLLILLIPLLTFSIAKADGCGLTCPKHPTDLLTFSLFTLCNFFTWGFCHIFSFIVIAIIGVIFYVFWKSQSQKKKEKEKLFLYGLFGIFIILVLYPYLKGFAYAQLTQPVNPCSSDPFGSSSTTCLISGDGDSTHTPSSGCTINYCKFQCPNGQATAYYYTTDGVLTPTQENTQPEQIYTATISNLTGVEYTISLSCSYM
jgi:hypothetical protein